MTQRKPLKFHKTDAYDFADRFFARTDRFKIFAAVTALRAVLPRDKPRAGNVGTDKLHYATDPQGNVMLVIASDGSPPKLSPPKPRDKRK